MAHRVFIIFLGLLVLFSQASDSTDLTEYWTNYCRDVVDVSDLEFVVKSLTKCNINDLQSLRAISRTDLTTCGMSLGDAARIKTKADSTPDAVATVPPSEVASATTVTINIEINNATVTGATNEDVSELPAIQTEQNPPVRKKRVVLGKTVDWNSILTGVVSSSSVSKYARILTSRGLDVDGCTKLDVSGLHSIGFEREVASRLLTKLILSDWLKGIVTSDDIPGVIRILLSKRVYLANLRKHTIDDLASCGLALGDATRIYKKAHPELAYRAHGRSFHVNAEQPAVEDPAADPTVEDPAAASTVEDPAADPTVEDPAVEETVVEDEQLPADETLVENNAATAQATTLSAVPIVVKIVLNTGAENVISNVATETQSAAIPLSVQLGSTADQVVQQTVAETPVEELPEAEAPVEELPAETPVEAPVEELPEEEAPVEELPEEPVVDTNNNVDQVADEPVDVVTEEEEPVIVGDGAIGEEQLRRHIRDFARRNAVAHSFGLPNTNRAFKLRPSQRKRVNFRRM